MKPIILSVFYTAFFLVNVAAQEVAPFQLKDQKGIALHKKNLPLLTSNAWTTYKQYQVQQGQAKPAAGNFMVFKFSPDAQFQSTSGNYRLTGTWKVENKRVLNLIIKEQNEVDPEGKIGGTYTVYKLAAEELVMVKNQTGDPNMRIIYYCKASKTKVLTESPTAVATTQAIPVDKKALETARVQQEQQALTNEIETEAQLRGIKIKEKLTKLDVKALQSIKRRVLAGEYQKTNQKG